MSNTPLPDAPSLSPRAVAWGRYEAHAATCSRCHHDAHGRTPRADGRALYEVVLNAPAEGRG